MINIFTNFMIIVKSKELLVLSNIYDLLNY